jgi:hypothetical protein
MVVGVWVAMAACGGASDARNATAPNGSVPVAGATPGRTYLGTDGYVEYTAGDLPIILSAPHGGDLAPSAIGDRTAATCAADADFSATNDANTQALVRLVADSLAARTGGRAHVVIARLARRKLDANRDSAAASCGDVAAGRAWHEYHAFLDTARAAVARRWPRGWYVDLHGHAHAIPRIELGYLLRGGDLERTDATLDATTSYETASSVRTLAEASPLAFSALLRGPTSFGALFAAEGYAAVPSPAMPGPAGAPYFDGGYDTARHGCRGGGIVCGVQAELPFDGVRDTEASRQRFAGAAARVLVDYVRTHLGVAW